MGRQYLRANNYSLEPITVKSEHYSAIRVRIELNWKQVHNADNAIHTIPIRFLTRFLTTVKMAHYVKLTKSRDLNLFSSFVDDIKELRSYNRNFFCAHHKNRRKHNQDINLLYFKVNISFGT